MGSKGKKKSATAKSRLDEVETVKDDLGLDMEVLADDSMILEEEPEPISSGKASASATDSASPRKKKKSKSSSRAKVTVEKEVVKESLDLEMECIETIREEELLETELSPTAKKSKGRSSSSKRSPRGSLQKDSGSSRDSSCSSSVSNVKSGGLGVAQNMKGKKSPRSARADKDKEKSREKGKESDRDREKDKQKEKDSKKSSKEKEEKEKSRNEKEEKQSQTEKKDREERIKGKLKSKDSKDIKKSPKPRREERGVVSAPVIVDRMASEPLSVRESMEHMQSLKNKVADVRGQLQKERDRTLGIYGEEKDLSWKDLVAMHIRLRVKIQRLDQELKDLRHSKTSKTHG